MSQILFKISEKLFVRDPQKTETGQAIVFKSIEMIDKLGFEQFNFKKLSLEVKTTEATVYRYFQNKQRLLHYLVDWYWTLMNFQIDFCTNNISSPEEKLRISLHVLCGEKRTTTFPSVHEIALQRIVVSALDQTFLTRAVDKDYKAGLWAPFKETCKKISDIIYEINPRYPFPNSLVSTAIHAVNHQVYYAKHLPILSDLKNDPKSIKERLFTFLEGFVMNTIKSDNS